MKKKLILSFCVVVFACQAALAQTDTPPGDLYREGTNIYDLNSDYDISGSKNYSDTTRIVVGKNGKLNFTEGSSVTVDQNPAASGIYAFDGGIINMANGSSLTIHNLVVGESDPAGGPARPIKKSEGTFNATGATIDANIAVQKDGTLNLTNTTVSNPEIGDLAGIVGNYGGTINMTGGTVNLGSGGWENVDDTAIANITGGQVNGDVYNSYGATFLADGTKFTGRVYNEYDGNMSLKNTTVDGAINSYRGDSVLKVDGVTVEGYTVTGGGRAVIGNELHVGADGLDMSGGYVMFYNNDRYNPGNDNLTTIVLTLTDALFAGMDSTANYVAFYLSDFITSSNFYWYGADGAQLSNWDLVDQFYFEFDCSQLSDSVMDEWRTVYDMDNLDSYKALAYDASEGGWYTGHLWDVVFAVEKEETDPNANVPEPATIAILGFGAIGAGLYRRHRKNSNV